jgi:putative nucleotidyltransferase with HDIG domain
MTQEIFHKILDDHKELSSLPQVLAQVIKVANDPVSSASNLADVIMKDPGLTARLLRMVNSPYYGTTNKIATVSQAVVTLGLRTVTAMALAGSIYELLKNIKTTIDRKKFWRHSLEVALASRMIAEAVDYKPVEEAFTAGLLHDIGLLILEASFPEAFITVMEQAESGENLIAVEEQQWGTNHARVGQFILEQWHIPGAVAEAAGHHHVCIESSHEISPRLDKIINLGNSISKFSIYSAPPAETRRIKNKKAIASALQLSDSCLAEIERNLIARVVAESDYLEIDVGGIEEVLSEANELLYRQYLTVEILLRENLETQKQATGGKGESSDLKLYKDAITVFCRNLDDLVSSMLDRTGRIRSAINSPDIRDKRQTVNSTLATISDSLDTVSIVVEEMRKISRADSSAYRDDNYITKIEARLHRRFKGTEKGSDIVVA